MEQIWERIRGVRQYILTFLRWGLVAVGIGLLCGAVGALFHETVEAATGIREATGWLIFLLPAGGLAIVGLYRLLRLPEETGTNEVFQAVRSNQKVPLRLVPLIFVSTVVTHLFGGSAGREGAALQMGGSIGFQCGGLLRFGEKDMHIATLCGMSAMFSALFGTPLTATVFSIEVISVGLFYYAAFVPCVLASLVAFGIARLLGVEATRFSLAEIPNFSVMPFLQVIALGILCALVSIVFCFALKKARVVMKRWISNVFLRIAVGGALVAALTLLVGSGDYNGAGMAVIARAVQGDARPEAFVLKILFTAVTIASGYKGGEIVPTLFVGATFGCVAGGLLGMDAGFGAAVGMTALFCGVTNTPIASILLGIELFGAEGLPFFAVAVGVSYMLSGYFGIYSSQKIVYSKLKDEWVDTHTI